MNNFVNNKIDKLSFCILLAALTVAGCKQKDIWPKETHELLNKRSIKLVILVLAGLHSALMNALINKQLLYKPVYGFESMQ